MSTQYTKYRLFMQRLMVITFGISIGAVIVLTKNSLNTISIVSSITQAHTVFETAQPNDLFIFDIDFTVLKPIDPVFYARNAWPSIFGTPSSEQLELVPLFNDLFASLAATKSVEKMFLTFNNGPISQEVLAAITSLQDRHIRILFLTARKGTEKTITIKKLNEIGINTASSFSDVQAFTLDELNKYAKDPLLTGDICYDNGILFAGSAPKGMVLADFFKKIGYRPQRAFFFDDHLNNIISVTKALKKLYIPSHGFFTIATRMQPDHHFDLTVIKKQFDYIKKHQKFISYEDTTALPDNGNPA